MFSEVTDYIQNNKSDITSIWMERMRNEADEKFLQVVSDQVFTKTSHEFVEMIVSNLRDSNEFNSRLGDFAEKVVRLGWPLTFVTSALSTFGKVVYEGMMKEGIITDQNYAAQVEKFDKWLTPMNNKVISAYTESWERTVSLQKIALQELSAPLIPVFEKISVMPLVGTIDTERARLIMENLLNGVVKHRAEVVLIDITGVPVVDTMVAHHIIQAAEAVRLVGAKCMLVGIRPEIAQTIVNLGIDLNQFSTNSTLRKGIEKALEMTNRKIVSAEGLE
ncbi:RsbT co-antagonist protein RsbRA [Rossellomorea aquimaris]|jgi:rsbT co-antagonist protein RsbR|uniref:STAS domain-containing protein n=1 Tax=Rossellomorea aquimaris TaxID=189382 RepID=A0A5D4UBZ4_9BACI|nr:RsbT co-antagonist protein RsbRA [Rossellomorea aquimaris]TYS74054.1 STAS domain-containing protein [Rossellomorea aquimaris]TYS78633.1 STAS domain-containing protein [Rossellomorea aquimaris]TYS84975.1 STAS domain-containing protein [Rossellomorea aquimaris]WRP06856.1 RsbT co-antagonist protein RsbRA [Rossellomorea aquimaris]